MKAEAILFDAALWGLLLTIITALVAVFINRSRRKKSGTASKKSGAADHTVTAVAALSTAVITAFMIARIVRTGHGPFTNMYEFSVAFTWGILVMSLYFSRRYQNTILLLFGALVGTILLLFANMLTSEAAPLVPALQNSVLLSAHVFSAVIAYGAFTIGLVASVLYLIQKKDRFEALPDQKTLEKLSYHSVIIGFPFMTLVIVLGAIWADVAWGRFWSWDPKETASLVTWLIYAGYMHTRIIRKWQGKKSAILLIVGFLSVVFTFFGNYIFNSLHSYI